MGHDDAPALSAIDRKRRVALSVTSFLTLEEVLRRTDLIAVMSRRLVVDAEGITMYDPPVAIQGFTKLAVWHERSHRNLAHRWVRSLLFETFASEKVSARDAGSISH
jgi:DNA-binding transcriptional LysR family regulator